jgi:glutamine amidotransferase
MRITIIDYGLSNLLSVQRAIEKLGYDPFITQSNSEIQKADILILPGVGAFADGMLGLERLGLIETIRQRILDGTPLLGICLGMQLLFDESEEFGLHQGLGLIPGRVVRIPDCGIDGKKHKVPHINWNVLIPPEDTAKFSGNLLAGVEIGDEVYFIHSFQCVPENPTHRIADTVYDGQKLCAVASNANVYGVQFHPEKSGQVGLGILKNFIILCKKSR